MDVEYITFFMKILFFLNIGIPLVTYIWIPESILVDPRMSLLSRRLS